PAARGRGRARRDRVAHAHGPFHGGERHAGGDGPAHRTGSAMRSPKTPARGALALALSTLLLAACGGEAPAGDGSDSLTRTLLDARARETREPPSPLRDVPVAELGFDFGSVDAPVRVVELSDFGCGYCRQ